MKTNNYNLVVIDPSTGDSELQERVSFQSLGVKERQNIEEWLLKNPKILGEELLLITKEFADFENSKKRLDVLAIDKNKKLVIVELKRDATGTLAELQAIRYAALCSTMTFNKMVELHSEFAGISNDDAKKQIRSFVEDEEFDTLDDKPRLLLVAGAFEDQHLTSTVLWLNKFGVEITCVELTPYRMEDSRKIAIVPRVIIPLPQAKQYLIQVKEKELAEGQLSPSARLYQERNHQILSYFRSLIPDRAPAVAPARNVMQIPTGRAGVHYEWWQQSRGAKTLIVGLHFEASSKKTNQRWCEHFRKQQSKLVSAVGQKVDFNPDWGEKWASVNIERSAEEWSEEVAKWAANKMAALISVTKPTIDAFRP